MLLCQWIQPIPKRSRLRHKNFRDISLMPPLPQGTLDLLILQVVSLGPLHGYAIAQRLQQISNDVLQVQQGSLYPALHRMEQKGWLAAEWGLSENNRRAKYYRLTPKGRRQYTATLSHWQRYVSAASLLLASEGDA